MTVDTNAQGPELLPCPFCGGEAYLPVSEVDCHGKPNKYQAACTRGCLFLRPKGDGSREAQARFWNRRAPTRPDTIQTVTLTEADQAAFESGRKAALREVKRWCLELRIGYALQPKIVIGIETVIEEIDRALIKDQP